MRAVQAFARSGKVGEGLFRFADAGGAPGLEPGERGAGKALAVILGAGVVAEVDFADGEFGHRGYST
jgi:hypothetical protein